MNSEPTGSIYLEIAKVCGKKKDFKEAIEHQRRAMGKIILINLEIYTEL